jgi:hypothetical protein
MSTLAERVTEAIDDSGVRVADIASACKISPQAVYDWKKGDTLEIEGSNLVELARLTGYNALWIAKGEGPKRGLTKDQASVLRAMEGMSQYKIDIVVKTVQGILEVENPADSSPRSAPTPRR